MSPEMLVCSLLTAHHCSVLSGGSGTFARVCVDLTNPLLLLNEESGTSCSCSLHFTPGMIQYMYQVVLVLEYGVPVMYISTSLHTVYVCYLYLVCSWRMHDKVCTRFLACYVLSMHMHRGFQS